MVDVEMNQEENAVLKPSGVPESINYSDSVRSKLQYDRFDKEFIRREESKLHEMILSLPEAEIDKLEDELTLIPSF